MSEPMMDSQIVGYLLGHFLDGHRDPASLLGVEADAAELDEAARLYAICSLDDDSALLADTAGPWLREHFPDDEWIVSVADALDELGE